MKKKLLTGLLLVTLAIGTLSPATVMAATTATKTATTSTTTATKATTPTKVDGVKISDLLAGKYNKIKTVNQKRESETISYNKPKEKKIFFTDYAINRTITHYKTDGIYYATNGIIYQRTYGKDYKDKTIDFGDDYIDTFTDKYTEWEDIPDPFGDTPDHLYNDKNPYYIPELGWYYNPKESYTKEIAKWKLDPYRFKTTKTKVTKDEIIITGTYTLSSKTVSDKFDIYDPYKGLDKLKFDLDFWKPVSVSRGPLDDFKDVKCDATVVFYRDTKQIKSLELESKLPKKGYATNSTGTNIMTIYNVYYTFEHQLTKEQKASRAAKLAKEEAERIAKITEEDIITGKANKYSTIETAYDINYDTFWGYKGGNEESFTLTKDELARVKTTGFDLNRFTITNSTATTIKGVYKLSTDADTLYDKWANTILEWNGLVGNFNNATAEVTITLNADKSMKKVSLKYNLSGVTNLCDVYGKSLDPERIVLNHTFTFK